MTDEIWPYIATASASSRSDDELVIRTELHTHANMAVVGKNAYILSDTGTTAEVNSFTLDHAPMTIKIVDAAVQYDCPYDRTTYILVIRNMLHSESMPNNIIPPFMVRESGIVINGTLKIQVDYPSVEDHSIDFPEEKFRIPLSLWGLFSYFQTSKPSVETLNACDEVFPLTPNICDPHQSSYSLNKDCMLDWQGNILEKKDRQRIMLSDIKSDPMMLASVQIIKDNSNFIDNIIDQSTTKTETKLLHNIPRAAYQVSSVLASVDPLLNKTMMYEKMEEREKLLD